MQVYAYGTNSTTGNRAYKISASNDDVTYTDIETIYAKRDTPDLATITSFNDSYKYYKFVKTNTSGSVYYTEIIISNWEYTATKSININKFTLDNNPSFTNNQRVLIETDKNIGEVVEYDNNITFDTNIVSNDANTDYESLTNITLKDLSIPKLKYNLNGIQVNNSYENPFSNTQLNSLLSRTTFSSSNSMVVSESNNYIEFDLIKPRKSTVKFYVNYSYVATLEGSNDGVNYDVLTNNIVGNVETTYNIENDYRFVRLKFNGSTCNLFYFYFEV